MNDDEFCEFLKDIDKKDFFRSAFKYWLLGVILLLITYCVFLFIELSTSPFSLLDLLDRDTSSYDFTYQAIITFQIISGLLSLIGIIFAVGTNIGSNVSNRQETLIQFYTKEYDKILIKQKHSENQVLDELSKNRKMVIENIISIRERLLRDLSSFVEFFYLIGFFIIVGILGLIELNPTITIIARTLPLYLTACFVIFISGFWVFSSLDKDFPRSTIFFDKKEIEVEISSEDAAGDSSWNTEQYRLQRDGIKTDD